MSKPRGTPRTRSARFSLSISRKKPRRWARQVYSIWAPRSSAMMRAILFSKPSSRWLVNGRLFGSAAMRRMRFGWVVGGGAAAAVGAGALRAQDDSIATIAKNIIGLREAEHMERASLGRVIRQVFHRV